MEDDMVDKGVYLKYCNDIIHFASWRCENQVSWFTDYGKAAYNELNLLIKEGWMVMLQNAKQNPINHVENTTPSGVMEGWIYKQANQMTLTPFVCWIWQKMDRCVPLVAGTQWEKPDAGFLR
jgi:hypothetical protein